MRYLPITLLFMALWFNLAGADNIQVPAEITTLQDAVDAAISGDTILISDEIDLSLENNKVVIIDSKALVFMSAYGDTACNLAYGDSALQGYGLFWIKNEPSGLTEFVNLNVYYPTTFYESFIYVESASVSVENCNFKGKTLWAIAGAIGNVIGVNNGSAVVQNCMFSDNRSEWISGGAIGVQNGELTVRNCQFQNNMVRNDLEVIPEIYGGAIYCDNSDFIIEDCVFNGNYYGHSITNVYGGGIAITGSSGEINGCTLYNNDANIGAAIYTSASDITIINSIIAFNPGNWIVGSVDSISCSNVYGNSGGDWIGSLSGLLETYGNISVDPLFCDTDSLDFRLQPESECLPANNECNELIGALGQGCLDYFCGDINYNGEINILDVSFLIAYLYADGPAPPVPEITDPNGDGAVNILDVTFLIAYLYSEGSQPVC